MGKSKIPRKRIFSANTFKTSYIAAVKEELGLLKRKRTKKRKVIPPEHLKPFIAKAIRENPKATYKEIQKRALELYRQQVEAELPFYGILGTVQDDILAKVLGDHGSFYGIEE